MISHQRFVYVRNVAPLDEISNRFKFAWRHYDWPRIPNPSRRLSLGWWIRQFKTIACKEHLQHLKVQATMEPVHWPSKTEQLEFGIIFSVIVRSTSDLVCEILTCCTTCCVMVHTLYAKIWIQGRVIPNDHWICRSTCMKDFTRSVAQLGMPLPLPC